MALTPEPRTGLTKYTAGSDPHPGRVKFNEQVDLLGQIMALAYQGTTSARPAAGKYGRFYWDTTVERLYWDDGATWKEVTTNGAGGAGGAIVPGVAGVEGTSGRSARADHTHPLALATPTANGGMSSGDKAKLDDATAAPTASKLVARDANGRAQFAGPAAGGDAANKTYVDTQVGTRAATAHTHDASDVTTGVLDPARLPGATTAVQGALSASDKTMLDGATNLATANALAKRDAGGRIQAGAPVAGADATTKTYVDSALTNGLATKANTDHVHDASDVTTGVLAPARLPAASGTAAGALSAADKTKLDSATSAVVNSALVQRSASGYVDMNTPTLGTHGANKSYVDTQVGTRALTSHTHLWADLTDKPATFPSTWATVSGKPTTFPSAWADVTGKPATFAPSAHTHLWADLTDKPATFAPAAHTHDAADITSGVLAVARLPLATQTTAGLIRAVDQKMLDEATNGTWASTLVMRDTGGRFNSQRPTAADHVATKDFVDDNVNTRASWTEFDKRIARGSSYTYLRSPDGGTAFSVNDNNTVGSGAIYNTNAASGSSYRAVWVNSGGILGYNLSSRKFKANEREYHVPLSILDAVSPKWYNLKSDIEEMGDAAPDRVNFIAEDLFDAGLTEYVSFEGDVETRENVQTINEQLMVNALWSFAKQQKTQIESLERRVNELAGA